MKIINFSTDKSYQVFLKKQKADLESVESLVKTIIADVKKQGDRALLEYTKKFDKATLSKIKVSRSEIEKAKKIVDKKVIQALKQAKRNVSLFSKQQLIKKTPKLSTVKGVSLWREWRPISKVGLYIPGGRNSYPSSVIMTGVPAKVAGCEKIVLVTPPDEKGEIDPSILVAADLVGVTDIFKVGGAQAIAALAYGTESVSEVDKIFGPGNKYVAAAKVAVSQDKAIDSPAGPSEVIILADKDNNADWITADLLAQAEHGQDSVAILLTTSEVLAKDVQRKVQKTKQFTNGFIGVIPNLKVGVEFINEFAPEHLELLTTKNQEILKQVKNAGAVFCGPYTPVAAGDYCSGSNHVLPTNGFAKMFSALSVESFGKMMEVQTIAKQGLQSLSESIITLAEAEELPRHGESVKIRI